MLDCPKKPFYTIDSATMETAIMLECTCAHRGISAYQDSAHPTPKLGAPAIASYLCMYV